MGGGALLRNEIKQTCNLPSKLRGMVTQAVGVAPLDVMAFSSS